MNLAEWREQQVEAATLPSGLEMSLKRVSLTDLVMNGEIPNTLISVFEEAQQEGDFNPDEFMKSFDFADFSKFTDVYNVVVKACAVEPPVLDEPSDEALGIKEISYEDKKFIFDWANKGVAQLKKFRDEEGES